jgi:transcriptional regulator with GAF, ATPase, and Fis domain
VGKEWLARAIHDEGPRHAGPFVAVNCGALPATLLESELFGHERGAFTGASRGHRGHFECAHGGTIFLDEVGEMPPATQVRLLRVLQEHRVQRVGGERAIDVDVRVLAATHRDPRELLRRGRLREDLYYRMAVVTLHVPPLRERTEDLSALVDTYLERFARLLGRGPRSIAGEALDALLAYRWPGNVRELTNVIERAVLLAPGPCVTVADLPEDIRRAAATSDAPILAKSASAATALADVPYCEARRAAVQAFERRYLTRLLERSGGHVGDAALRARINARSLYALMRRHGLRKEDFRYARSPDVPPA